MQLLVGDVWRGGAGGGLGCLTHTSVIEGPESRAADPALEGAEGVDADAFGTGSGISALVYICSTRRRTGGSVKNNRGLELVPAPKQRANAIWTFNPPGSHFSGETKRQAIECERGDACHLRRGPSRTWRSRHGTRRCTIPPC